MERRGWALVACRTLAACAAYVLVGCARDPSHTAPPVATALPAELDLAVLPNNTVLQCSRSKITALRRQGDVAWELTLPDGDGLVAPPAIALNSVAYLRGAKGVYAATPEGKWAWTKPLERRSSASNRKADAPVTFPDSTVALVVGDDVVRFDERGAVKWRVTLPEGQVSGQLSAGMDGALFVPTTTGVYCLSPDGNIAWKRAAGS